MMPGALNFPEFYVAPCSTGCGRLPNHTPTLVIPRTDHPKAPFMLAIGALLCAQCQSTTVPMDLFDGGGRKQVEHTLRMITPGYDPANLNWSAAWIRWEPVRSES